MSKSSFPLFFTLVVIVAAMAVPGSAMAATLTRPPNNLGLQAYWPFDEAVGTRAIDHSGSGKNGTLINTPTWVTGKHGKALSLNGTNQYMTTSVALTSGQAVTISGWLYSTESTATYRNFFDSNSVNPMIWWNTAGQIEFDTNASFTTTAVYRNTWVHVALVKPAGNTVATYYVNGVAVGTGQTYTVTAQTPTWFNRAAAQTWLGKADDVRVYNRALSAAEIANLYTQGEAVQKEAPRSGLLGEWLMNDGAGSIVHDTSGLANTGSLINTPPFVSGKHGKALSLNGSNQYVNIPSITSSQFANGFTWAGWVKTNGNQVAASWMWPFGTTVNNWLQCGKISGSGNVRFDGAAGLYSGGSLDTSGQNIADGNWHQLVCIWDKVNGFRYIYVDGVQQASVASTAGGTPSIYGNMYLGAHPGPGEYWNGQLDDMRIYSRALTAAEVTQLYNEHATDINTSSANLQNGTSLTSGLAGLWTFDGNDISGTTVTDRSGSGNNAVLTGGPMKIIGKLGQALSFTGSNSMYVEVPNITSGTYSTNFTVSAWIKYNDPATYQTVLGTRNINTSGWELEVPNNQSLVWRTLNGSQQSIATFGGAIVPGVWTHVAVVHTSGSASFYINGRRSSTQGIADPTASGSQPFRIGYIGSGSGGSSWEGGLDDVRIYSRALTAPRNTTALPTWEIGRKYKGRSMKYRV